MQQPPELLKSFANRLARLACSKDGQQITRLLRLTNLLGDSPDQSHASEPFDDIGQRKTNQPAETELPERIGIWERKQENGKTYFVRSKDLLQEWNYWANIGRIEPKGAKQRVVLIGESVARGYLYDPQYTPAMALEKILHAQWGKDEVEVIDLARTNLGMEVRELALAALQLEPNAVIIFSGNNWRGCFPPQGSDVPYIDTLLHEEGMVGPKRYAEEKLEAEVRRIVNDVASVYASRGVPLVWIIPEFNLADWRDPLINAPHLLNGRNEEWITLWKDAQCALQAKDYQSAADLAQRMTEIDQQTSVAGLYILAECSQKSGDLDAARRYLELARDSVIWDSSKSASPRTYSIAQKALREETAKLKNGVIDMPELFRQYLKGGIPDRRLFLDYCHLTTEGIQITMAAAAACVLHAVKGVEIEWPTLVPQACAPSREIEAEAAFLAAVHNAHWWQSADLVRHYCAEAVRFSPEIAKVMNYFIDLQTRRTPMLMCKSAQQVSELGSPLIQHYLLRYNYQQLDETLLGGIVQALRQLNIEAQARLEQLRKEEHSVASRDIDLLEYYYCSAGGQPQEVVWVLPRRDRFVRRESHFYKGYWLESKFVFISESLCPVKLQITARVPNPIAADDSVAIEVNGNIVARFPAARQWESWEVMVAPGAVNDGINEVVVRWPMPEFPGKAGYLGVINDLAEGNIPEFFCVFGEIHAFIASDGRKVQIPPPEVSSEASVVGVP
jgi:tetratricopeptide (TPR) repeat protein